MEKSEPSYTVSRTGKWYSHCGQQTVWELLKGLNSYHWLSNCSSERKTYIHVKSCTWMFWVALIITAKRTKQFKCSSTDKFKNYGIFIRSIHGYHSMEYYLRIKGIKYWYMSQHEWTWKTCYVKECIPKRSNIVQFHLYEISRRGKSIETTRRLVVAREGNKEYLLTGLPFLWGMLKISCN